MKIYHMQFIYYLAYSYLKISYSYLIHHGFCKFVEAGSHSVASWDVLAEEVSSGCMLEIFRQVGYHLGNCCVLQNVFM